MFVYHATSAVATIVPSRLVCVLCRPVCWTSLHPFDSLEIFLLAQVNLLGRHGSASLCRDGQITK